MLREEFERSAYTELVQFAAALDRMSGQCPDKELSAKLWALRGPLDAVLQDLSERCGSFRPSASELVSFRWRPWDKI